MIKHLVELRKLFFTIPNKEKITEFLKLAAQNGIFEAQEILRKNIISWG